MKREYVAELVRLRLTQAREALDDAQLLLDSGRSVQGAGSMTFRYASRDLAGKRNDLLLGLGAILLVAAAPASFGWLCVSS